MTDRDPVNLSVAGTDQDGKLVKVLLVEEEITDLCRRYRENANAQSGHGKSNLIGRKLRELLSAGRHL